jgi:hypothetical protein
MFKRVLVALTFVVALGAAGLGMSGKAEAGHGCGYGGYGHGYRSYYPSYYDHYDYGSRVSYYRSHGHRPHRHHDHHHHDHGHSGVYFSIGF